MPFKMKNLLQFLFVFMYSAFAFAQDIDLVVKKGTVEVSSQIVNAGQIKTLKSGDIVKPQSSALYFITNKSEIIEPPKKSEHKYDELKKMFKQKQSFTKAFTSVLLNQNYAVKKTSGSSSRGAETEDPLSYFPNDSVKILSDFIVLKVGNSSSKLLSDIQLFKENSKDTISLSKNSLTHKIKCPAVPGNYFWKYTLSKYVFQNNFYVPDAAEKKKLLAAYNEYKKSIEVFSKEMQQQLLQEYYNINKIYAD
jgi:hypothetical protein